MSTAATPALPPPPTPDNSAQAVPSVQQTTGEKVIGGIGSRAEAFAQGLSGLSGARPHDFADSSVGKMLQQHYDSRLAEARVNYNSAQQLLGILNSNVDPDTGGALSPDKRAKYMQEANAAWGAYAKSAGVNKEAKAAVQQKGQLFQLALTHGIEAAHQIATKLGLAGGGGGGQNGAAPQAKGNSAVPPPPSAPSASPQSSSPSPQGPQASGSSSSAATQSTPPAAGSAPNPAVPPPPNAPSASPRDAAMEVPRLTGEIADRHTIAMEQAKQDIITHGKIAEEEATAAAKAAHPPTPRAGGQPKVLSADGVPYAVERVGADGQSHIITKDSPEFGPEDQRVLDAAGGARSTGENDKQKMQQDRLNSYATMYAKMRGQVQQYSVIDKTNGEPTMANANTINANPGRYMAASLGQQLKNRAGVFEEIGYTKDQFNKALDGLTEDDFKTLPRAQIAAVLQDRNPESAMSTFVGSEIGATLNERQMQYVTGLASMQESAMSLRSIAGMGQGSDSLRSAITKMLPGAETPSKRYADRQMELFTGELEALHKAVPDSSKLGMGKGKGMTPPPTPKHNDPLGIL